MAKAPKLKVFRTPIGFHDAYVAATSRKAALAAWGSDANLFARGMADEVTDPELMKEPLASPGTVIKRLRGTADEQIDALPKDRPKAKAPTKAPPPEHSEKPKPRPSRDALDAAEKALAEAEARQAAALKAIAKKAAALERERHAVEEETSDEIAALQAARDAADAAYEDALDRWRG